MNRAPHVWHWIYVNSEEGLPRTSTNAPPLLFTSYEIVTVPVTMCLVAQSCRTLWDSMNCSPAGSSVHGESPGKDTGVRCHALLQGIFPTQGSNPGLLHCRQIPYRLSHQGNSPVTIRQASPCGFQRLFYTGSMDVLHHGYYNHSWGFPGGSESKESVSVWEAWVQFLGWEEPLEEAMATPVFLPAKSHWQRSLAGYSPWGSQRVQYDWVTNTFPLSHSILTHP